MDCARSASTVLAPSFDASPRCPPHRQIEGRRHGFCYIPVRIFEAPPGCLFDVVSPIPNTKERPARRFLMAAKTVADVMKMVSENEVKFIDFRFTDTRGKEQHVSVPLSAFDEDKFTSGHAFDGSS